MSNFLAKGKRASVVKKKKEFRKHLKRFYKILKELDRVFIELMVQKEISITEDNIVQEAEKISKVKIGEYEGFILKGKLHSHLKDLNKLKINEEE